MRTRLKAVETTKRDSQALQILELSSIDFKLFTMFKEVKTKLDLSN